MYEYKCKSIRFVSSIIQNFFKSVGSLTEAFSSYKSIRI